MRALNGLLRAFLFFALFAFALNNQQPVEVNWFFGFEWRTRMVFVVLAAFAAGCAVGMLALLPGWWRGRSLLRDAAPVSRPPSGAADVPSAAAVGSAPAAGATPVRGAPDAADTLVPESRLREGL
jgi:lipopolysaccharide assembly protein A